MSVRKLLRYTVRPPPGPLHFFGRTGPDLFRIPGAGGAHGGMGGLAVYLGSGGTIEIAAEWIFTAIVVTRTIW